MTVASTIRVERDPEFWRSLLMDPANAAALRGIDPGVGIDLVIGNPTVLPIASENGGYIFVQMDPYQRVWDLHAVYSPQGRGREAHDALKRALDLVSADLVLVFETEEPGSRPPASFGFRAASDGADGVRTWVLTREAWEASKARARMH